MSDKPDFKDITLFDQETGEPFTFTAKEQEFFWRQGFTNVPKYSPERRKEKRDQRYKGKPIFNVKCVKCGRVGKILQEPLHPNKTLCGDCFNEEWEAYSLKHPEERAAYEAAMAAVQQPVQ